MLATDRGTPPLTNMAVISINVTDINDNPPRFSQAAYTIHVSESVREGTKIIEVWCSCCSSSSCSALSHSWCVAPLWQRRKSFSHFSLKKDITFCPLRPSCLCPSCFCPSCYNLCCYCFCCYCLFVAGPFSIIVHVTSLFVTVCLLLF